MILAALALLQSVTPGMYESAPPVIPGRDSPAPAATAAGAPTNDRALDACMATALDDASDGQSAAIAWIAKGGDWRARQCLGFALSQSGDYAAAQQAFARGAGEAQTSDASAAATLWVLAGNAALAGGDAAAASRRFDTALAGGGLSGLQLGEAYLDRARARVAGDDVAGAAADLERARRDAAADPLTWLLSATLARRGGDLDRAASYLAEAARRAPTDPAVMLEAGNIAVLRGDDPGAQRNWQAVLTAAPEGPEAASARANLAQLQGPAGPAQRP